MPSILVRGGRPLEGYVPVSGSKNAALPIIAATLLSEKPVALSNVPLLEDVLVISDVLRLLGAGVERKGNSLSIDAGSVSSTAPPYELVNRLRASFLVLGPLLARFGEARVPLPGGCEIGARPVGEHIAAMEALGATVEQESGHIIARADRLRGTDIYLSIVSVGATENALMAAALAEGSSRIHNAAIEPEVLDLCSFLERLGVGLEGVGSKSITVHGVKRIAEEISYSVIPDRVEAATYLLAIIGSGGQGGVRGADIDHFEALLPKLHQIGVEVEASGDEISVRRLNGLRPLDIQTAPYPGFPTDMQPQICTVLTAADGLSTVTESIFENRLTHIPELARMGAKAQTRGNSALIEGTPGALTGVPVEATDLRCAAALVIAGLMASGETRITGLNHLRRGYEDMPQKMALLGGSVSFVEDDGSESLQSAAV